MGFTIGGAVFERLPGGPYIADLIKAVLSAASTAESRGFTDSASEREEFFRLSTPSR
jgi:hypothetical protein